jgi:predicted nuclease of restriction endonuclease-like RecB superfamily
MIDLLTEVDLDWVESIIDVVERNAGQPWRIALEQLDDLQRATQPTNTRRFNAVVGAVQRITGGRLRNSKIARQARGLALGHPALTAEDRSGRISHAALMLGTTTQDLEKMLWCDLPRERPVELPGGRPSELEAAAFANITLLQRAVRRAKSLALTVRDDDPSQLVRAAIDRGLLVTSRRDLHGVATIEIVGPLALCKGTNVYGRALADLVPLLAEVRDWALEIRVELPLASYSTHVMSPVLLPAPPTRLVATSFPILRLMKGLARADRSLGVMPLPPPLSVPSGNGAQLLWPDLVIDDGPRRIYVELLGFWTRDFLERKLAAYRAIGAEVILCVDAARPGANEDVPPDVLPYTKFVTAPTLIGRIRPA